MENRIYHLRKMETDNQLLRLALKRELLFNIKLIEVKEVKE